MIRIRDLACIALAELLDPVGQIVLAQLKGLPETLVPGYAALCQRKEPLDVSEVSKLGPGVTALVGKEREANKKRIAESLGSTISTPASQDDAIVSIRRGGKGFGPETYGLYFLIREKGTNKYLTSSWGSYLEGIQLQLWPTESHKASISYVFTSLLWLRFGSILIIDIPGFLHRCGWRALSSRERARC